MVSLRSDIQYHDIDLIPLTYNLAATITHETQDTPSKNKHFLQSFNPSYSQNGLFDGFSEFYFFDSQQTIMHPLFSHTPFDLS